MWQRVKAGRQELRSFEQIHLQKKTYFAPETQPNSSRDQKDEGNTLRVPEAGDSTLRKVDIIAREAKENSGVMREILNVSPVRGCVSSSRNPAP